MERFTSLNEYRESEKQHNLRAVEHVGIIAKNPKPPIYCDAAFSAPESSPEK